MKTIFAILMSMALMFIGALSHERDIIKQCKKNGISNAWTETIKCEVIP